MSAATSADVVIVGGGPAGCAAALTLRRYSTLSVVVVEQGDYHAPRVGETVPPSIQPLLGYLGVWEPFVAAQHLPAHGTCAAWGSPELTTRDFLFTGRGAGWHLDRRRFDEMLAEQVSASGGALLPHTRVAGCTRTEAGAWHLTLAGPDGEPFPLAARFLIEASGKKASLAKKLGARQQRFDRLVGVMGFFEVPDHPTHLTLVEAVEAGWWYSALLPDGRVAVAFMSDADLVRGLRAAHRNGWLALLAATHHTRERLAGGTLLAAPRVLPAFSHLLHPLSGPSWLAAGDALASFDPLASMGIGHALSSGSHAARVAHDLLTSDGSLLPTYTRSAAQNVQHYLALRQRHYLREQRWPDAPFWARRQGEERLTR